ncbi:hypothetical protein L917_15288 [Phytophthora nicotianae]|uniref:Uncharacterized protein n=1 Tax=Phytophthora nicotianae TaxID=4792 RepID=W2KL23_PHYNI|nr:hypothetical protein L917_15288 [Phytophthora nicotianae]
MSSPDGRAERSGRPSPEHVPVAVLEMEFGVRIGLSTHAHLPRDDHRASRSLVTGGELAVRSQDNRLARGGSCAGGSTTLAKANEVARSIIADPCLQPPELIPDWQDRYLTGAVPGDSAAAASTVGSGVDDSSTPAPPPAARSSLPPEEEKVSSSDTSLGVLAEAARRLSSD